MCRVLGRYTAIKPQKGLEQFTPRTDHDLDHLQIVYSVSALMRCWAGSVYKIVQVQPWKRLLEHAGRTAPTR